MEKLWQRIFFRLTIPIVGIVLCVLTMLLFMFGLIPLVGVATIVWIITSRNEFEKLSIVVLWPIVIFFYYIDWLKRNKVIKE